MIYADESAVLSHLKIKDDDQAAKDRVTAVENGLAETFDGMIGRRFGFLPVDETRTLQGRHSTVLVASAGLRAVTSIEIGGAWDGAAWINGRTLEPDEYGLWGRDRDGIAYGIEHYRANWDGPVRVTGLWGDQAIETVPDDVREALTVATVKEYRRLTSSPQDVVGPDMVPVVTPSGLSDPQFKAAVDRYRLVEVIV